MVYGPKRALTNAGLAGVMELSDAGHCKKSPVFSLCSVSPAKLLLLCFRNFRNA